MFMSGRTTTLLNWARLAHASLCGRSLSPWALWRTKMQMLSGIWANTLVLAGKRTISKGTSWYRRWLFKPQEQSWDNRAYASPGPTYERAWQLSAEVMQEIIDFANFPELWSLEYCKVNLLSGQAEKYWGKETEKGRDANQSWASDSIYEADRIRL